MCLRSASPATAYDDESALPADPTAVPDWVIVWLGGPGRAPGPHNLGIWQFAVTNAQLTGTARHNSPQADTGPAVRAYFSLDRRRRLDQER